MELYWTAGLLVLCFLGLSWFAGTDAPYVATKMDLIDTVLKKAGVKKDKKFYELGSGDGRVVFQAALLGADSVGIEQSWLRVLYSRWKAHQLDLSTAHFTHGNIFQKNYSDADVIYAFLLQKAIDRLEQKLYHELKKGSTVITQRYHFKSWKPKYSVGEFRIYQV